jgi:opacity protein-like surface antigen
MNRGLMLAACVAAVAAAASSATASTEGAYVSGNGGVSLLPNLDLKSNTLGNQQEHFKMGGSFGGAAGYDYGNGWRVEVDSLYTNQSVKRLNGAPATGHISSTSVMLNAQKDLMDGSVVTPYVGAGLGVQDMGGTVNAYTGRAWKPAYQAEAGLRSDLSQQMSLFGEYRFSQSESTHMTDGVDVAHQHFSDHGLMAGLTYHFGQ